MKGKTWIQILSISQSAKHAKCDSWMSNNRFWLRTNITQQRQAHYMYLQMEPVDNPLSTRPIRIGREFSIELYPNGQFRVIDNPDRQFGASSDPTRTWTRSHSPEPLVTLVLCQPFLSFHRWYSGESAMVIVVVYISSLFPYLLYRYGRLRCMFSTAYLGEHKQRYSVCNRRWIGYSCEGQRR